MDYSTEILLLQRALNYLALFYPALPRLSPTGVFDESTLEAVMTFQRDFLPPVTGIVDERTWYHIFDMYASTQVHYGVPKLLRVFTDGRDSFNYGELSGSIFVAESLLNSLSALLDNFEVTSPTGANHNQTNKNFVTIQYLAGISPDGQFNRITWEYLARLYHAFIVRRIQKPS